MGFFEILLIGVSLSMDAFAVAVCKGLSMRRIDRTGLVVIGLYFGGFQALMPLLGYALGTFFADYVNAVAHWITFALLAFIGGKMVRDTFDPDPSEDEAEYRLDHREMLLMAIATSIDAFAVGVTFAFERVNIWQAVAIIGCTTFALSLLGVLVGHKFGHRYEGKAQLAGGIVLILIGVKQVAAHFWTLPF